MWWNIGTLFIRLALPIVTWISTFDWLIDCRSKPLKKYLLFVTPLFSHVLTLKNHTWWFSNKHQDFLGVPWVSHGCPMGVPWVSHGCPIVPWGEVAEKWRDTARREFFSTAAESLCLIYGNPKTEKLDTFSNAGGHIIFDILEIQFLLFDR